MTKKTKKRINIFSVQLVKDRGALYELDTKVIRTPDDAVNIVNKVLDLENQPKEHFVIFSLSAKHEVIGVHTIHIGTLDASIVHPRDVFQPAILNNASSIIAFHNHPSGDTKPSQDDIEVTKRLNEAGRIIGIELLDHIIIGEGNYTSFKGEMGHLFGA